MTLSARLQQINMVIVNKSLRCDLQQCCLFYVCTLTRSVFLYGWETSTINAEMEKRINAFEMSCYMFPTPHTPQTNKYEN